MDFLNYTSVFTLYIVWTIHRWDDNDEDNEDYERDDVGDDNDEDDNVCDPFHKVGLRESAL